MQDYWLYWIGYIGLAWTLTQKNISRFFGKWAEKKNQFFPTPVSKTQKSS